MSNDINISLDPGLQLQLTESAERLVLNINDIGADSGLTMDITHDTGGSAGLTVTIASDIPPQTLNDLSDVNINGIADGHIIAYDVVTSKYVNYQLTTARVANIDEAALADGAVLLYDGASSKYKATVNLNNPNTMISGGVF